MSWHTDFFPYVMDTHVTEDWGEWGSAPRGPLITCDMAHRGELMASVIGESVTTLGKQVVYHVIRCELCIATHIWPLPAEADLAEFYRRRFYHGPAAHEVAQHERDREWYDRCVYGPVLNQCQNWLWEHQQQARVPRVLDIGAGSGLLLDAVRQRGWPTMGVEPDKRQCIRLGARGHTMHVGTLSENSVWLEAWKPDVVCLWETLEHTVCPEETLLQCYDFMRPGALLVISVPNDNSPLQQAVCAKYHREPYWWIPPVHLWYFTPKCLQLLVRRCGFALIAMRGTFPLEHMMLEEGGQSYIGNEGLWRQYTDHKIRIELKALQSGHWDELEARYRANIADRIGRSIICIAQKV